MEHAKTCSGEVLNGKEEMEDKLWKFKPNEKLPSANRQNIRAVLELVLSNLKMIVDRPVIPLGHGDPSAFESFKTASVAEDAVIECISLGEVQFLPPERLVTLC